MDAYHLVTELKPARGDLRPSWLRSGKESIFFMSVNRRARLASGLVCLFTSLIPAWSQNQSPPQQPGADQAKPEAAKPAEQAKPADQNKPAQQPNQNPFENVQPAAPPEQQPPAQQPPPAQPGKPQLEAPKPTPEAPAAPAGNVIEEVQYRGARRV